jgi:DNA-binding MarR family transcriptional regulator
MDDQTKSARDLSLLEEIQQDPDTTQATLATRLGVAVGTVNWHLKRLIAKGYVKVKRAERRKLRYIITPEGLALRARLTVAYVEQSMSLYRRTRLQSRELLSKVMDRGYRQVQIVGQGELADVCRLTCLESGLKVLDAQDGAEDPQLVVDGMDLKLNWPPQNDDERGAPRVEKR